MVFDVSLQKLKCMHCGTEVPVKEYNDENRADESADADMTVYTCRSCGARLISPEPAAAAFCSYCGSQQILESKLNHYAAPEKIIPFAVTKDSCRDAFRSRLDTALYAPKEFRDPQFLERFRGIYIPYWRYEIGFENNPYQCKGTSSRRKGDYVYEKEYDLTAKLPEQYDGILYDASSNFDDTIAETIAPFEAGGIRPFRPGYLAGFYADSIDVKAETYEKEAVNAAADKAAEGMKKAFGRKKEDIEPELPDSSEKKAEAFGTYIRRKTQTLLPVWFLTWRKDDRVAYAVVNGQTGTILSDLPVDSRRFFLISFLTAAVLFVLMTLFVSMTAPTALLVSAVIAAAVSWIYCREIRSLHDHENHVFDKGYFIEGKETELTAKKADSIRKRRIVAADISAVAATILFILGVFLVIFLLIAGEAMAEMMPIVRAKAGCAILLIPAVWCLVRTLSFSRHLETKSHIAEAFLCFLAVAAAFAITVWEPVEDWYYYAGCIFCLCCVFLTCLGMIRKYNLLSTRAIPVFFDRTGGERNA